MKQTKLAMWIFFLSLAYAVARYNVFGVVAWANIPVYVCNKAFSWTGLILFGLSLIAREKEVRRGYGKLAVAAISAHVVMSALVLNPAYFEKFFAVTGRMNCVGELSMLAGVLGVLLLWALFTANLQRSEEGASLRAGWGRAILWLSGIHVLVMGFAGWLTPEKWPGYMPPISLLSFLTAAWFLYHRGRRRTS